MKLISNSNNPVAQQLIKGLVNRLLASRLLYHIQVKNHPVSLEVTYAQQVEFFIRCWRSVPRLPLQINNYRNSSRFSVGNDPIYWAKIFSPTGIEPDPV